MDRDKGNAVTDWFVHDPAEGRVGPLSADDLRTRYRQRRVQRDTLVWHAGMREWQPLDRVSDQVGIDDVVQDTALPPPLPPPSTGTMAFAASAPPRSAYPHRATAPPRRGLSGCAIAAIVVGVVGVFLLLILAAIALPAYQDYTIRAKTAAAIVQAEIVQRAIEPGRCPMQAPVLPQPAYVDVLMQPRGGRCAYLARLRGVHAKVDGAILLFTAPARPGEPWTCETNLPPKYAGHRCVADAP